MGAPCGRDSAAGLTTAIVEAADVAEKDEGIEEFGQVGDWGAAEAGCEVRNRDRDGDGHGVSQ